MNHFFNYSLLQKFIRQYKKTNLIKIKKNNNFLFFYNLLLYMLYKDDYFSIFDAY